jgi:hypothetical protein
LYQPLQLICIRQECLNLWHLVEAGHIIDMAHFAF